MHAQDWLKCFYMELMNLAGIAAMRPNVIAYANIVPRITDALLELIIKDSNSMLSTKDRR